MSEFTLPSRSYWMYIQIYLQNLENINLDSLTNADLGTTINATRHAVSLLYDPKGKFKSCHHDLKMLRVKLATNNMCLDLAYKQQFG